MPPSARVSGEAMATENGAAGQALPPRCEVIELRVADLRQVFHAIDASPYRDRQLDPGVEEFIVNRACDASGGVPLGLMVYVDRPPTPVEAADLKSGVHQFFDRRGAATRRQLQELFRGGRVSLVIGLAFLGTFGGLAQALAPTTDAGGLVGILRESLIIGGWVAMWRPLEVFLYDWWPIRAQANRYDRLAAMPIAIHGASPDEPQRFAHVAPLMDRSEPADRQAAGAQGTAASRKTASFSQAGAGSGEQYPP